MPSLLVNEFAASNQMRNSSLLGDKFAQTCDNGEFSTGVLKAFKYVSAAVATFAAVENKTIWKVGANLIAFGDGKICSVVNSFIQESNNRFFYTGDSIPKQSNDALWPTTSYRLGVTPPSVAPTITIDGAAGLGVQDTVSYVFTMVSAWGEESAPSPQTAVIEVMDGQHVDLSVMTTPTDASANFQYKRIYRLSTGSVGAEYLFLAQIAFAGTTYADENSGALKAVTTDALTTEDWAKPPDGMKWLTKAHNGMLLGVSGKELYVSEPYVPYAWPTKYKLQFDSDITGVGAANEFIVVISGTCPYIITGATPDSLVSKDIKVTSQCLYQRGVVATPRGVFYPAKDGLCLCDGTTVTMVTGSTHTSTQWQALFSGATINAKWYGDQYVAFKETGTSGFIIDPDTGTSTTISGWTGLANKDIYYDAASDNLYLLVWSGTASTAITWEGHASAYLTYAWKSKKFVTAQKFTCAKVRGSLSVSDQIYFKYYLNGVQAMNKLVSSEVMFRLPPDPGGTFKEFKLTGSATIESVQLATSPQELL